MPSFSISLHPSLLHAIPFQLCHLSSLIYSSFILTFSLQFHYPKFAHRNLAWPQPSSSLIINSLSDRLLAVLHFCLVALYLDLFSQGRSTQKDTTGKDDAPRLRCSMNHGIHSSHSHCRCYRYCSFRHQSAPRNASSPSDHSNTQITTILMAITSLRHAAGLLLDHRTLLSFSRA